MPVIAGIGPEIDAIYVVDDACPDQTGALVEKECRDKRVRVIYQQSNTGVGGAMVRGYREALNDGFDILVKMDGDGQMDPKLIPRLLTPLLQKRADYVKGNRFHKVESLSAMPKSRIIGNIGLSFLSKLSSGYWSVFDPTNGFTALHRAAAVRLPLERLAQGYFFESDMLFRLGMIRAVVEDMPMDAVYGNETSGISIPKIIPEFIARHYISACKRIYFSYFLSDFGLPGLQLLLGKILLAFGVIFGSIKWMESTSTGIPATAGTVVLAALPVIIGTQLLFSFLNFDTKNMPTKPLQSEDTL